MSFTSIIKLNETGSVINKKISYSEKLGLVPRSGGPFTIQTPSEPLTEKKNKSKSFCVQ